MARRSKAKPSNEFNSLIRGILSLNSQWQASLPRLFSLFFHNHVALYSFTDVEALEYFLDENNNCNHTQQIVNSSLVAAQKSAAICDAMLSISAKMVPVFPKFLFKLIKRQNMLLLNRWYVQGVSCYPIARSSKKVAQFVWKLLRKVESHGLDQALGRWPCYIIGSEKWTHETPLPSVE